MLKYIQYYSKMTQTLGPWKLSMALKVIQNILWFIDSLYVNELTYILYYVYLPTVLITRCTYQQYLLLDVLTNCTYY